MADSTAISASEHARRYDIDALRVFAFGLLILYHVGMFYVADWGWHVKSNHQAEWLQLADAVYQSMAHVVAVHHLRPCR